MTRKERRLLMAVTIPLWFPIYTVAAYLGFLAAILWSGASAGYSFARWVADGIYADKEDKP